MKKFAFALMAIATMMMVSCKGEKSSNTPAGPDDEGDEDGFVSMISTRDNSLADWDNVPVDYLVEATCPDDALFKAMKWVKVYADQLYINYCFEFDPTMSEMDVPGTDDYDWLPVHIYLNADNKSNTGGYADEFLDANAEVLLEGGIQAQGVSCDYNPAVFQWWGNMNGGINDQSVNETSGLAGGGWMWTDQSTEHSDADGWGAIIPTGSLPIGTSQRIGNVIEGQILRELIGYPFDPVQFGIGFDIQSNWSSNGVLPQGPAEADKQGRVDKLVVKIDMSDNK